VPKLTATKVQSAAELTAMSLGTNLLKGEQVPGVFYDFGLPFEGVSMTAPEATTDGYINWDKADATGKMIRTVPQPQLTQKSVLDGEWVEYDFDMLPLLREAYDTAKAAGVLQGCEFDRMVVTGTNIGFEMFAEFDAAIEVSEMRLTGYLK
jgi:hypothetical protein